MYILLICNIKYNICRNNNCNLKICNDGNICHKYDFNIEYINKLNFYKD